MIRKKITINKKEYKANELKGQDLFLFMNIADKLNISLKQINSYAGEVEIYDFNEFVKKSKLENKSETIQKDKYADYLSGQQGATLGLGILTFIFKSAHKVKNEINELISTTWEMPLEVIKTLNLKDYAFVLKGTIQIESIKEAFKTFFQSSNQK